MSRELEAVLTYHRLSSLSPEGGAVPAKLERASEPIPFRRYDGAPRLMLPATEPAAVAPPGVPPVAPAVAPPGAPPGMPPGVLEPRLEAAPAPAAPSLENLSAWLGDGLGLSGWKRSGEAAFGLRATPSAGNLHPTETYLLIPPGLPVPAGLHHYSPFDHTLELRRRLAPGESGLFFALTTIYWRTAWKYGERAFRLAQLDAGHAAASLAAAAALLGWTPRRVAIADQELDALLGLGEPDDPEAERGLLLFEILTLAAAPSGAAAIPRPAPTLGDLLGRPSRVSEKHRHWPGIPAIHAATAAPGAELASPAPAGPSGGALPVWPREILRRRRSHSRFDTTATLPATALSRLLEPLAAEADFLFPWRGELELALFVHRVDGLDPGLYRLDNRSDRPSRLAPALRPDFEAAPVATLGQGSRLLRLGRGDARAAATTLAGGQPAAGDSAFTVVILGRLAAVAARGGFAYRALHWQAGELGHRLYLGAEAAGLGATGLSGFHDRRLAELLGLGEGDYQPLYLMAVGAKTGDQATLEPPLRQRSAGAAPLPPSRGGYG